MLHQAGSLIYSSAFNTTAFNPWFFTCFYQGSKTPNKYIELIEQTVKIA